MVITSKLLKLARNAHNSNKTYLEQQKKIAEVQKKEQKDKENRLEKEKLLAESLT